MSSIFWLTATCILWSGLILGVSFIATPVKFQAPNLTMPVALEIGKATFHLFNRIEWIMFGLVVITAWCAPRGLQWSLVIALGLILAAETFWLLPALDIRAERVIAGNVTPPGSLHLVYVVADSAKVFLLLGGAGFFSWRGV